MKRLLSRLFRQAFGPWVNWDGMRKDVQELDETDLAELREASIRLGTVTTEERLKRKFKRRYSEDGES
jgi:hypothetical protein